MNNSVTVLTSIFGGAALSMACGGPLSPEEEDLGLAASACSVEAKPSEPSTRLFVPPPRDEAKDQVKSLIKAGQFIDAALVAKMAHTSHAVWLTGGSPKEVKKQVKETLAAAKRQRSVPVLVAYNLPFRDCAQYSSGGAADTAEYAAWIDAVAAGIGKAKAIVLVEPDGLGIIPYNTTIYGQEEWCKPTVTDEDGNTVPAPGATPEDRYAALEYAVAALAAKAPNALTYLDGTHAAWLGVGEAAYRIFEAGAVDGVLKVQGFFVNVSNYRTTAHSTKFGTWVSRCITAATAGADWARGHFDWCPSQYNADLGYALDYSDEYAATVDDALVNMLQGAEATTHFVIDTSRNGQGPLATARYAGSPYNQPASVIAALDAGNWCNARGAGLGLRPTLDTGVALLDAYLWVKVPGESDGSCDAAGGARGWDYSTYNPWAVPEEEQSHFDPLWEGVDPAAGDWFPEQALELATNAEPPLF
jgi:endoglucanase